MVRIPSRTLIAGVCALFMFGSSTATGQAPGAIIGTGTFTSFVENMDRSLAFYHDTFDMDVPAIPATGERPYNRTNPQLFAMFDIPGARERHQSARVPGTRLSVEMMEIQDRGAARLQLRAQNVDAMVDAMKAAGLKVVSQGETAVPIPPNLKGALVADPNNFFLTPFAPCDGCAARIQ